MIECYCDDSESFSVYSARIVCARKPHKCYECSAPIKPGDRYEYSFGVYDGYGYSHHTCERCLDIRQFIKNSIPCFCWAHGSLHDDVENIISEAYYQAADEVRGLRFGVGRLLVKARQERRRAA